MAHLYPDYSEDFGDIVSSAEIKVYQAMNKVLHKVPILLLKIIRAWAMALLVLWAAVFLPRRWLLCSADHRWVKQVAYLVTPISSVIR